MMIDAGTWQGKKNHLANYVKDLKEYVDNKVDLLVVTHEHKDHVYLFDVCEEMFLNDFEVDEIWMSWAENDLDEKVKIWKDQYGQKKKAFTDAVTELSSDKTKRAIKKQFQGVNGNEDLIKSFENFKYSLNDFRDLHLSLDSNGKYKGGLKGMEIVKNKIANGNIRYLKPGDIVSIKGLESVNFNILGPPQSSKAIKKEHGNKTETYDHNKVLRKSDLFGSVIGSKETFDSKFAFNAEYVSDTVKLSKFYNKKSEAWRAIGQDWLIKGAGDLALRLNTGINNLSLAMAIEFEESGRVMLFPGDAEFGSWESWHNIDWGKKGKGDKHLTEDLLNRTVFYKVSHHLSHNGTAKEKGLEMMNSDDLVAMATLDFNIIGYNWKNTMPNRAILKELLAKTKGRLIIMNESKLFYDFNEKIPLTTKIENERMRMNKVELNEFEKSYQEAKLYKQYRVKA